MQGLSETTDRAIARHFADIEQAIATGKIDPSQLSFLGFLSDVIQCYNAVTLFATLSLDVTPPTVNGDFRVIARDAIDALVIEWIGSNEEAIKVTVLCSPVERAIAVRNLLVLERLAPILNPDVPEGWIRQTTMGIKADCPVCDHGFEVKLAATGISVVWTNALPD